MYNSSLCILLVVVSNVPPYTSPTVVFTAQPCIHSFLSDGIEAWSDWRIHNIPTFTLTQSQIDEGNLDYPYRMNYSDTDKDYNKENAQEAMNTWLGGEDNRWSRVWWDVANNNF